jgi:four helix bundle protein
MHRYKDLEFWRRSKDLAVSIYRLSAKFPSDEKFGITNQMRRASVSIASNIAEGSSRSSDKDFRRFLEMSMGSAYELETQLLISKELGYLDVNVCTDIMNEVGTMIRQISNFKLKCLTII